MLRDLKQFDRNSGPKYVIREVFRNNTAIFGAFVAILLTKLAVKPNIL